MSNKTLRNAPLVLFVLVLFSQDSLWACRFNVRETGFVDLGVDVYRLVFYVGKEIAEADIERIKSAAEKSLVDTPVMYEIVNLDQQPDHPAAKYHDPAEKLTHPSARLFSPSGATLALGPVSLDELSGIQASSFFPGLVSSPLRAKIAKELAKSYAVVLFFEGLDAGENERARAAAQQAMKEVEGELDYMPKPMKHGPVLVAVTREELEAEHLLLWSFELEREAMQQPHAAVVYGRGRWLGPLLKGDEITPEMLSNILFVVGADCECGLNPRLIRGTGLPIHWSKDLQEFVAKDLDFDPENPLIRMEVAQILKVNSWYYPGMLPAADKSIHDAYDAPLIEDEPRPAKSVFALNRMLYLLAALTAVILGVGVFMIVRARRAG